MADISKVTVGGVTYNIKDSQARTDITNLQNTVVGGMHFLGEVNLRAQTLMHSVLTDLCAYNAYIVTGSDTMNCYYTGTAPTAATITISDVTYTISYIAIQAGDFVIQHTNGATAASDEFVFAGADSQWHLLGSPQSVSATYTPTGTIDNTYEYTDAAIIASVTQGTVTASGNYTPAGTISQGTNPTASVITSYGGSTSKLETTTVHNTPTTITATAQSTAMPTYSLDTTKKLDTVTITGVGGTVNVYNPSEEESPTLTAEVASGSETLTLTSGTLTFSAVSVAKAAAETTTVATGSASTAGSGTVVGTALNSGTSTTATYISGFTNSNNESVSTLVTGLTEGTGVTVATGTIRTDGEGGEVMIGLGTANTTDVLTGVAALTFNGTQDTVTVSGNTSGVDVSGTVNVIKKVTSTFTGDQDTIISN